MSELQAFSTMRGKMHGKDQVQLDEFQLVRCSVTNLGELLVVPRILTQASGLVALCEVQNSDFSDCVDAKK